MNLVNNRQLNEWTQEAWERVQVRTGLGLQDLGGTADGPRASHT